MTLFLSDINIKAAIVTAILIIATIFNKSVAQELKTQRGIILSSDTTLLLKDGHARYDSVFLTKKGIVLEEVLIKANGANTKLRNLEILKTDLNKKNGIYYEGRPPLALLNPFGGKPITFFYELLSKGGRQARKMKSTIQTEYEHNEIDEIFNATTIRTVIDIDDSQLERFILQFRPTLEEARSWSVYDFQVYVKKSFESFVSD
ncbi:MAG: hypothetical protein LBE37_07160 [Sphingobacterium sp.]|jgi:hypothetical protein|nr:hypothetical protein [Sphingobacterium sp.]